MTLTGLDQLWVADITYVRLQEEFIFLGVILDAYSRRVIGWALDRTMEDDLTLAALRMALAQRTIRPELVHHSDRGFLAVCQQQVHRFAERAQHRYQHVAQGNSWGQRGLRIFYEKP